MLKQSSKYVFVRRYRKVLELRVWQMGIILLFVLVSTLISLWLPMYFAMLPLNGG